MPSKAASQTASKNARSLHCSRNLFCGSSKQDLLLRCFDNQTPQSEVQLLRRSPSVFQMLGAWFCISDRPTSNETHPTAQSLGGRKLATHKIAVARTDANSCATCRIFRCEIPTKDYQPDQPQSSMTRRREPTHLAKTCGGKRPVLKPGKQLVNRGAQLLFNQRTRLVR